MMSQRKSFTLIELLIAMVILAILAIMIVGNFNSTLKRGRDAQRKSDLTSLQRALELYYEDNQAYPSSTDIFNKALSITIGSNRTTYMVKTPQDPSTGYTYVYTPETTSNGKPAYYYLYSYLENIQDQGNNISQTGFSNSVTCDVANILQCKYYVKSSNAPELTPNP